MQRIRNFLPVLKEQNCETVSKYQISSISFFAFTVGSIDSYLHLNVRHYPKNGRWQFLKWIFVICSVFSVDSYQEFFACLKKQIMLNSAKLPVNFQYHSLPSMLYQRILICALMLGIIRNTASRAVRYGTGTIHDD